MSNVLTGTFVTLEPLQLDHATRLLQSASDPEVWRWKSVPRPETVDQMAAIIRDSLLDDGNATRVPYAIVRAADRKFVGSTSVYNLSLKHRRADVGWTWVDRSCWGRGINDEAKYLLLRHCFETLDLLRVGCGVDHLNVRSQRAVIRVGFREEGRLRSHMIRLDGTRRDTISYSILAEEWPGVAARLLDLVEQRSNAPAFGETGPVKPATIPAGFAPLAGEED